MSHPFKRALQISITIAAALVFAAPAVAQPAVSAVSIAGDVLTIDGSKFGEHPHFGGAQPFLNAGWHDFENRSFSGGNLERETAHAANWSIDATGNRPNSRYSISKTNAVSRLGEFGLRQNSGGMNGMRGTVYASFWIRVSGLNAGGKFFRAYGDAFDIFLATGESDLALRAASSCGSDQRSRCAPSPTTVWGSPRNFVPGTWHRVDVYMRDRSSGKDDYIAAYLDGARQWQRGSALPSKANALEGSTANERQQWIPAAFAGNGHTVGVGQMIEGGGRYSFDDVFIDYTWAHVELGNAPTYAASSIRETQIPLRWSANKVVVNINRGAFPPGQKVFVYVIDENGVANPSGYPVTLGPRLDSGKR